MHDLIHLLIVSSVHWHFTWQRHHEMAAQLAARGYRVTYLEPLPKRWPGPREARRVLGRLRGNHESAGLMKQALPSSVTLDSIQSLPDVGPLSRWWNRTFVLPRAVERLNTNLGRRRVILNYLPLAVSAELQRRLKPDLSIYDCVWDWSNDPYSKPGALREEELLQVSDIVFADSPYLFERMRSHHASVHRVLPAVRYDRWEPARQQRERAAGDRVRCAYFGAVGENIDVELLHRLSEVSDLRIVGPVQRDIGDLARRVRLVDPVPQSELPALIANADVLVLPYCEARHTQGVIPAKTFECLATGKPVIAKGLQSLQEFGDLFTLCETNDDFLDAVLQAGRAPEVGREARLALAKNNSWTARADMVDHLIRSALDGEAP